MVRPAGRRQAYGQPQVPGRVRLCHSNKELQEEVARIVMEKIEQNPDVHSIGIGLDDVSPETFCQCEVCKAFGPTLSDRVARYDSAIAEIVSKTYPNRYVTMFAYAQWRNPPQETKLHPNVILSYVGVHTHGYLYTPDRVANHELFDGWA